MNNKVKIAVAHHKKGFVFENALFLPIHVGKELSQIKMKIQGDDIGDNISYLNPFYCEVTAIYWLWKNVDIEYYGLNHYRRYFCVTKSNVFKHISNKIKIKIKETFFKNRKGLYWESYNVNFDSKYQIEKELIRTSNQLARDLEIYDMIVPHKCHLVNDNVETFFGSTLGQNHIKNIKSIIDDEDKVFKDFFIKSLQKKYIYPANIFIFKKEIFSEYCSILFRILEKHYSLSKDSLVEYKRIGGYMAELITNAFIQMIVEKGYKYKKYNIMFIK